MRRYATVRDTTKQVLVERALWCKSFLCRLRGLTFRRDISMADSLILDEKTDSRMATAIHMLFVFCPIAAVWINSSFTIVDTRLARPFRLFYLPRAPARYILEGPPELLSLMHPGDRIYFED